MKRISNLYQRICSVDNLMLADKIAQRGKRKQYGVISHNRNKEANILNLHEMLTSKAFSTSEYTTFKIYEPKERLVYKLPYFPDRITHHAVMNVLEPIFLQVFTADSYSCIKGKGIHAASEQLKHYLKNVPETTYCLKLDITKFYPSVNHDILKALIRRKFKDPDLLNLLDGIIDSAEGLPIGNYLSQYLANFYLSYFDHFIKEELRVKYYLRYADDIVILSDSKEYLWNIFSEISKYLQVNLKLKVKGNYKVFPVSSGIDFVGYVHYHTHTRLRKSIKQNFARMLRRKHNHSSVASYLGWAKHADARNLIKTLLKNEII
jgi:RNA-directed DNA polymerase